jgi:hypothetical protein
MVGFKKEKERLDLKIPFFCIRNVNNKIKNMKPIKK